MNVLVRIKRFRSPAVTACGAALGVLFCAWPALAQVPGVGAPAPLPDLRFDKQITPDRAAPGNEVTFTVHVGNHGSAAISPARLTDQLAGVLDDADLVRGPTSDNGAASITGSMLSWSGTLLPGQGATITFTVRVHDPDTGDKVLRDSLGSVTPGAHCAATPALSCGAELAM
jgi:uncharacterized repeat protein (TIGR01451 family)